MNIGIHFFDLLIWLFGPVVGCRLHQREPERMAGFIELELSAPPIERLLEWKSE